AADLGYEAYFVPETRYAIMDDHVPFAQRGFPAALIIGFSYPYWHTTEDTVDKVSAESLQRVGRVLQTWLEDYASFVSSEPT
ncbi:MAG: M28 family peptidase, partial [Chloroflexi bacterium]|nr:M28 family peptidase [Chloroflexota bacterium]